MSLRAEGEETSARMPYHRVHFDGATRHWFPHEPETEGGIGVDAREFTECAPYEGPTPLYLKTKVPGPRPPAILGPFYMPVLDRKLGDAVAARLGSAVQTVPAVTDQNEPVCVLNILDRVACIDETLTLGTRWRSEDGRPDKLGQYRLITELALDASRITSPLFRVATWEVAIIAEESLAREFFSGVPGLVLTQVA